MLEDNFYGELSPPDGGEGIRWLFALCKKTGNTRSRVLSKQNTVRDLKSGHLNPLYEHSENSTKI